MNTESVRSVKNEKWHTFVCSQIRLDANIRMQTDRTIKKTNKVEEERMHERLYVCCVSVDDKQNQNKITTKAKTIKKRQEK